MLCQELKQASDVCNKYLKLLFPKIKTVAGAKSDWDELPDRSRRNKMNVFFSKQNDLWLRHAKDK